MEDLVIDVDKDNINDVLAKSNEVATILDCHAEWCPPCKRLAPMLYKAVKEAGGRLRLAKLDVDAQPELAQEFRVESMPTVFAIVNEKIVERFVGLLPQADLDRFVANVLSQPIRAADTAAKK
jgi:putative thioredoxin